MPTPAPAQTNAPRWARPVAIANNFVHDLSTGLWAACLLVVWILDRQAVGVPGAAAEALGRASQTLFVILLVALFGLAVTGGFRLRYWRRDSAPEDLADKRTMLWVKHVIFLLVYGAGTLWAWWLVK